MMRLRRTYLRFVRNRAGAERLRSLFVLSGWLAVQLPACAPLPPSGWWIHVERPKIESAASVDRLEPRLIAELGSHSYRRDQLAPEQLAALALSELRKDHAWDAAALLALASYRAHVQQEYTDSYARTEGWQQAYRILLEQVPGYARQRPKKYIKLAQYRAKYDNAVKLELEALHDTDFYDELERAGVRVGSGLSLEGRMRDIRLTVLGHVRDRQGAELALQQRGQVRDRPLAESFAHPSLAAAICQFLSADLNVPLHTAWVAHILAATPIRSCRVALLNGVRSYFDTDVLSAGLVLYRSEPSIVSETLASPSPTTRAHAAVILGLALALNELPRMEAALATERDEAVRRSLQFALVWLGESQHVPALTAALEHPEDTDGVRLLAWLPAAHKAQLSQTSLVALLADARTKYWAKRAVVSVLHSVARVHGLDEATLMALETYVRAYPNDRAVMRAVCELFETLAQLERAQVLAALRAGRQPLGPWLARFRRIVVASDLELLDQLFASHAEHDVRLRIVSVLAEIPGTVAQAVHERWVTSTPALSLDLAVELITRADLDKPRLAKLLGQLEAPAKAVVSVAIDESGSIAYLRQLLLSSRFNDRYQGCLIARVFGSSELIAALWSNVNYTSVEHYPADLALRHAALSALLQLEMKRRVTG